MKALKKKEEEIPKRSLESILNELTKYSNLNREDIPTLLEHIKKIQDESNKESPLEEVIRGLSLSCNVDSSRYSCCGYLTISLSYKDKTICETSISGEDIRSILKE